MRINAGSDRSIGTVHGFQSAEDGIRQEAFANASLITAAPDQHEEMVRHLTILERLEADPELWARMTKGTGIATLNAYRAAIAKATAQ